MMTMNELAKKLRHANRKNYYLYLICNFVSLLLITAYAAMMLSPTILNILPVGGDSRKQVTAIFVMACVGCVVFTIYAASLFYRMKSRELGVMMAIGASKKRLKSFLFSEVLLLSGGSTLAGTIFGIPLAWMIWRIFRLFIVDTEEMKLVFDFRCLLFSLVFILLVIGSALLLGVVTLKKTNIMDIVHAEHKNEQVREVKKWCGPVGIVLIIFGALAGYYKTSIYMRLFSAYPPAWLSILYAPVFIGLYMILLHTVVHGWKRTRKNPYKGIIARSMMKFQGKQTVRNMMVITVLIAGACFAIFFTPMMAVGIMSGIKAREYDYQMVFRDDQKMMSQQQIEALAKEYDVATKDWHKVLYASIAMDGQEYFDDPGGKFHYEYNKTVCEGTVLSESDFSILTGEKIDVPEGTYDAVIDKEGGEKLFSNVNATLLTNMVTKKELPTSFHDYVIFDLLKGNRPYYVLDDGDYDALVSGCTDEWKGQMMVFNVGETDNYQFAVKLFHQFISCFDQSCALDVSYDRAARANAISRGEEYYHDRDTYIRYDKCDSYDFRSGWMFMPNFKILDQNTMTRSYAVFMMMFVFISIVCMMAALMICYIRSITIASNNSYVFEDLKRLGASPDYLKKEVKNQVEKIYAVPSIVGIITMYLLYIMILYSNDGTITPSEFKALIVCMGILVMLAMLIYLLYRRTCGRLYRILDIR